MIVLFIFLLTDYGALGQEYQDVPRLDQLIDPKEHYQLRDTLSQIFDQDTPLLASDSVSPKFYRKRQYNDKVKSITSLNRDKKEFLFQGDIQLTRKHLQNIVNEQLERGERRKRTAFRDENYPKTIWKPYVPYILHSSLSEKAKTSLQAAITFWQQNTCIEFKPRTNEEVYLLMSGQETGCWSTVGRDEAQKSQILNIGDGCDLFGITSHEVAHSLGLFHEQSRYDRNIYVEIDKSRIAKENFFDFSVVGKKQMDTYNETYDIGSVMHYKPAEFSTDGGPTIMAKDVNMQATMGQFRGPSFLDVAKLNKHYGCDEVCTTKINCENGGFQNSRNCGSCVCPTGFGGKDCSEIEESYPVKCHGNLTAGENQRQFNMNIKPKENVDRLRKCNYHIYAPPGKRIVIVVDSVIGNCVQGCYEEGVELKMYEDKTVTGARFCCTLEKPQTLISEGNMVTLTAIAGKAQTFIQLRYSYVEIMQSRSPVGAKSGSDNGKAWMDKVQNENVDSEAIRQQFLIEEESKDSENFERLLQHGILKRGTV